jgi:single-strand DNA-binding protein
MSNSTIILKGRLGRDAELKATANGNQFISFSMAVDEMETKDRKRTDWYSVSSSLPNHINGLRQYLTKGKPIEVIGSLTPKVYTDRNGVTRPDLNVRAFAINFIDFGGKKDEENNAGQVTEQAPVQQQAPQASAPVSAQPAYTPSAVYTASGPVNTASGVSADPEDDLPF